MNRSYISLFFSLVFIISIITPSVLSLVTNNKDIIAVVDITEEENKENEIAKDFEIKFLEISQFNSSEYDLVAINDHNFYLNLHSDLYFSINSPPPEFV